MDDLELTRQVDPVKDAKPIPLLEIRLRNLTWNGREARIVSSHN